MLARIVALSGPLKGTVVPVSEDPLTIGRDPANALCVASVAVSRKHCHIVLKEDACTITDLESSNGTFVNGVPTHEHILAHGDEIRIGDTLFLFCAEDDEESLGPEAVELKNYTLATNPIELPIGTALEPQAVSSGLRSVERLAGEFRTLVEIGTAVNSLRDVEQLERRLLEAVLDVVPAERGAVLRVTQDGTDIVPSIGVNRSDPSSRVDVSRTVARHVLDKQMAILSNDVLAREDFGSAASLKSSEIRSVLAVPLVAFDKTLGLIYLDSREDRASFDEGHLRLLTAIAAVAAVALANARYMDQLGVENRMLRNDLKIEHNMVGESSALRQVQQFISKVAPAGSTVSLYGESGTGKELVARAIHRTSPRAEKPFVAINCASLDENLLASELFGHEKGAFTGATSQKKGKLEIADGGTVFLDEIGELAPNLQAKLLRVLQDLEFERVGGTRSIKVDVRIITATNRNLTEAVKNGDFREDLYYRINVVSISVPPLRERRDDISLLANYFAQKYSLLCNRRITGISDEARTTLVAYHWPGNVRELENAIERAIVMGSTDEILPEDLPESLLESAPTVGTSTMNYHEALRETKRQLIFKSYREADGNLTEAAKLMDVHPNYLHKLIASMNLREQLKKG